MGQDTQTPAEEFFKSIEGNSCIKNLKKDDKKIFKEIILHSYNSVFNTPTVNHIDYTPHEQSHLRDIYKIVSNLFVDEVKGKEQLFKKELLILDLAIFFHDVGMHGYELGEAQRAKHAYAAYEFVKCNLNKFCHDCSAIGGNDGINCIAEICGAHSDAYGEHPELDIKKLRTCNTNASTIGEIRVLLLAVILRLADELDICYDRISNWSMPKLGDDASESIRESHYKHWQMCELFNLPVYNSSTGNIEIKVRKNGFIDSNYITPFEQKFKLILSHIKKLYGSDYNGNDYLKSALRGEDLTLQTEITGLLQNYQDTPFIHYCSNLKFKITYDDESCGAWCKYKYYLLINQNELYDIVSSGNKLRIIEHKSLKYVDRELYPCIYDYMNLHKIIDSGEEQLKFASLVNHSFGAIIEDLRSKDPNNFCNKSVLVGVDSIGSLLATMLGNKTMLPLISYAPKSRSHVYPRIEVDNSLVDGWYSTVISKKEYIFIVCDSIYSFDSISACLKDLGLVQEGKKIDDATLKKVYIFCLFDRKPLQDIIFKNSHNRLMYYNELKSAFKLFPIIGDKKTNFVRKEECIFCMLKKEK